MKYLTSVFFVFIITLLVGCGEKDIDLSSPEKLVKVYFDLYNNGDWQKIKSKLLVNDEDLNLLDIEPKIKENFIKIRDRFISDMDRLTEEQINNHIEDMKNKKYKFIEFVKIEKSKIYKPLRLINFTMSVPQTKRPIEGSLENCINVNGEWKIFFGGFPWTIFKEGK